MNMEQCQQSLHLQSKQMQVVQNIHENGILQLQQQYEKLHTMQNIHVQKQQHTQLLGITMMEKHQKQMKMFHTDQIQVTTEILQLRQIHDMNMNLLDGHQQHEQQYEMKHIQQHTTQHVQRITIIKHQKHKIQIILQKNQQEESSQPQLLYVYQIHEKRNNVKQDYQTMQKQ